MQSNKDYVAMWLNGKKLEYRNLEDQWIIADTYTNPLKAPKLRYRLYLSAKKSKSLA